MAGVLTSMVSVLLMAYLFGFSHEQYVTLLPKSITTAIGMGVSEELGGLVNLTVASIIITGILGNVMAELICKIFRIQVSEELGGLVNLTVASIIITGILGNVMAELICKIFRIQEPVAQGLAIGTASHALGTVKAIEMGDLVGAISSLAIVVSGLLTVGAASLFANFL